MELSEAEVVAWSKKIQAGRYVCRIFDDRLLFALFRVEDEKVRLFNGISRFFIESRYCDADGKKGIIFGMHPDIKGKTMEACRNLGVTAFIPLDPEKNRKIIADLACGKASLVFCLASPETRSVCGKTIMDDDISRLNLSRELRTAGISADGRIIEQ